MNYDSSTENIGSFSDTPSYVASGLGAIAEIGSSVIDYFANKDTNNTNKKIAQENLEYQREALALQEKLMREGWARDDSAYQRKFADLRASGLSATLAAGGGVQSSNPIHIDPLHNDYKKVAFNLQKANYMQMAQDFATKALENRILYERAKQEASNSVIAENNATTSTVETKNIVENGGVPKTKFAKWVYDVRKFYDKYVNNTPFDYVGRRIFAPESFLKDYSNYKGGATK